MPSIGEITADFGFTINQADLTAKLRQAENLINGKLLQVKVGLDASQVQSQIQQVLANVQRGAAIKLKLDTTGLAADVQRVQALAGRAVNINVRITGTTQAVNDVNTLRGLLAGLQISSNLRITTDVTALQAVNTVIGTQITQLTALIAQLRSLGGGGGGGGGGGAGGLPAGVRATLLDVERLNNLWTRGQISAQNYSQALTAMQTRLEGARAAAGRGTEEFAAIDKQITKLTQSLRGINTDSLTKIRTDMAAVRTAFDTATGGISRNSQQFRDAVAAYQTGASAIEARLKAMAQQGNLTASQMGGVNRMLGTLAREQGTIAGGLNHVGLSGNIFNALQSAFPIIMQAGGSVGAAAANTNMLANGFLGAARAAGPLGLAVAGVTAAIGALVITAANSVEVFGRFQHAMQGVKAVSDTSGKTFDALKGQAVTLAREFGVNLETVAQAQEELFKAGRTTADVMGGATRGVIILSKATGTDLLNSVAIASSAMNVFGLKGTDMAQVADIIANGANKTALDVNTLGVTLQQVGNVAADSGLSLLQTVAVLGMMADKGMSGSDAGTSLKVMLQRLKAPTDQANAALKEHGVAVYDASGKQRDMIDILKDTINSMNGMSDAQRNSFTQTVFGTDAVRAITVMFRNGGAALDDYIAKTDDKGRAERDATTRTDDLVGAQQKLNTNTQLLKTSLGELFSGPMLNAVNNMNDLVMGVTRVVDNLRGLNVELGIWAKQVGIDVTKLSPQDQTRGQIALVQMKGLEGSTNPADLSRYMEYARELETLRLKAVAAIPIGPQNPDQARLNPVAAPASGPMNIGQMASAIGLAGAHTGTPFGGRYFGNQIHNGEDFFAPVGTPVTAPFEGYLSTRWSKTTGHIVEIMDAAGNKILMGHLDRYAKDIEARAKAAGGKLLVQEGQIVAYVGQTGSLAHPDIGKLRDPNHPELGTTNSHTHVMAYRAGSTTAVNPLSVQFEPVGGEAANTPTAPTLKSFQAYIKEAQRLQNAIEAAQKANKPDAWRKATDALDAFTKSNDLASRAVEWVGKQQKVQKDLGLSDADWAKYKTRATQLAQLQADIASGKVMGNAALSGDRQIKSFQSDPTKNAALAFAAQQLVAARKAGDDLSPITDKQIAEAQRLEAALKKAQDAHDIKGTDAATNAITRFTQASTSNARALAAVQKTEGTKAAAGSYIASLSELKKYGDDALKLIKSQEEARKSGDDARIASADRAMAAFVKDSKARASVVQIEQQAYSARQATQSQADQKAKQDQAKRDQDAKTAQARAASLASDIRSGNVTAAEQALASVQTLRDRELLAVTDNAAKKLEIMKRYAKLEYDAQEIVTARTRDNAIRDAQNKYTGGTPADKTALAQATANANSAYASTMKKFGIDRDSTIQQAQRAADDAAFKRQQEAQTASLASAKTHLDNLVRLREHDLTVAGDNAALRLAAEKKWAAQIQTAKDQVAQHQYTSDMAGLDPKDPLYSKKAATFLANRNGTRADDAAEAAQRVRDAQDKQTAAHDKAVQEQAKARQEVIQKARELDLKGTELAFEKLKTLRDLELTSAGNDVAKRLAIQTRYASDLKKSAEDVALAQWTIAKAADLALPKQLQEKALSNDAQTYWQAMAAAKNNPDVKVASDAVTSAVQKQRDAYSKLGDTLRQHIAAGDLDAATQHDLEAQLNALDRESVKLGISTDKNVDAAHRHAWALEHEAATAFTVTTRMSAMIAGNTDAAESAVSLSADLQALGDTAGAIEGLQSTYDHLSASLLNGEATAESVNKVAAALQALQDSLSNEGAVNDWLANLSGSIDEQLSAIADKLSDPSTSIAFKKQLQGVTADFGTGQPIAAGDSGFGDGALAALDDQKFRASIDFQLLAQDLGTATGAELQDVMKRAADYLASAVGQSLPKSTRDALQSAIDAAAAYAKVEIPTLADYPDGAPTYVKTPEEMVAEQQRANAHTDALGAADLASLEFNHSQGLISDQRYYAERDRLETAAAQATYDRSGKTQADADILQAELTRITRQGITDRQALEVQAQQHLKAGLDAELATLEFNHTQKTVSDVNYYSQKATLEQRAAALTYYQSKMTLADWDTYQAELTRINREGVAQRMADDQKALTAANQHATGMLALERSNQQAALNFKHSQGGVSDRGFIDAEQAQAEQAALDKYLDAFNTVGSDMVLAWQQYQADMTAASNKGVTDREALDKQEFDTFVSGIDSMASALGGLQSIAGTALTALGGALKISQTIGAKGGLIDQTKSAFGAGGSIFDKLGAVGGWLGVASTAINLIGSIGDAIMNLNPAFAAWKKNLLDIAETEKQAMGQKKTGLFTNPYYDALKKDSDSRQTLANAGFWQRLAWNIFGGAPQVLSDEAANLKSAAATIFTDLGTSISNSLSTNLLKAVKSGDFSSINDVLKTELNDFITKAAIDAVIAKSNLSALISQYADDSAAGRDTSADLAGIRAEESRVTGIVQAMAPGLPSFSADASTAAGGSGSSFGTAPAIQGGLAAVEIQFPASLTASFDGFASAVPIFSQASSRMLQAANLIVGAMGPKLASNSGNGALI